MNEFYRAKFNGLFAEFTRYLVERPEVARHIPDVAEVVSLDNRDPEYNRHTLAAARATTPKHPVVYVEIGEMSPVRSRLRNPPIIPVPTAYALV